MTLQELMNRLRQDGFDVSDDGVVDDSAQVDVRPDGKFLLRHSSEPMDKAIVVSNYKALVGFLRDGEVLDDCTAEDGL